MRQAGEAGGPPDTIVPSSGESHNYRGGRTNRTNLAGTIGGPAASPASGTNSTWNSIEGMRQAGEAGGPPDTIVASSGESHNYRGGGVRIVRI